MKVKREMILTLNGYIEDSECGADFVCGHTSINFFVGSLDIFQDVLFTWWFRFYQLIPFVPCNWWFRHSCRRTDQTDRFTKWYMQKSWLIRADDERRNYEKWHASSESEGMKKYHRHSVGWIDEWCRPNSLLCIHNDLDRSQLLVEFRANHCDGNTHSSLAHLKKSRLESRTKINDELTYSQSVQHDGTKQRLEKDVRSQGNEVQSIGSHLCRVQYPCHHRESLVALEKKQINSL